MIGEWMCDETALIVELVPSGAFATTPRVVEVVSGDCLEVSAATSGFFVAGMAMMELVVESFRDWGKDKGGWHVSLHHRNKPAAQHFVRVETLLDGWKGVWV